MESGNMALSTERMNDTEFERLHEKYGDLFDGPESPERRAYAQEAMRRKAESLQS